MIIKRLCEKLDVSSKGEDKLESSLFSKNASIKKVSDNGATISYHIKYLKNNFVEYNELDIYINKNTFFIERIVLFYKNPLSIDGNSVSAYKEKPRLEIVFKNIDITPTFSDLIFAEGSYFSEIKGNIVLAAPYRHYKLINQRIGK